MRWQAENSYDGAIRTAASRWGVPFLLVKAVVAQESGFNPAAYRSEPQIVDASRGLMQVLFKTARSLGYAGPTGNDTAHTGGLYDVPTNLDLGAHLLRDNLNRVQGDVDSALSAYNGGFRPELGFGTRRADGTFRNQAYVDGVREKLRYFSSLVGVSTQTVEADATDAGSHATSLPLIVGLVVVLVGLIVARYMGGK